MRARTVGPIALAVLALAAAPAVAVKPENKPAKPDKPGKAKGVTYVFKGVYSGDDSTVAVDHTNKHARDYEGPVTFDFSEAKIRAKDASGNRSSELSDASGDRVVVKSKMPRKDPQGQPFPARQLVEQTPSYEVETG